LQIAARLTSNTNDARFRDEFTFCFGLDGILGAPQQDERNNKKGKDVHKKLEIELADFSQNTAFTEHDHIHYDGQKQSTHDIP